ncbi:YgiW/YdeI family stress tolerance OB fold protein [Vagococcus sp. WN89Y]|uniref:YgiW/YdeI family stress tolerance OB fold protein n=1 Tax=Vagococcus sp. WN89Y TaxID=3457258 RepID=UPI003FCDA3E4
MHKLAAFSLIFALGTLPAIAANQGGFTGPSSKATVATAKTLSDDAMVTLRGNIIERISGDTYIFKDPTGTINIEIDDNRWNGVTVGPDDLVEIHGEVDKDWNSVEIDVKQISKVAK